MISMIWAMDESHLIGDGDKIPWHIKEDLLFTSSVFKGSAKTREVAGEIIVNSCFNTYETVEGAFEKGIGDIIAEMGDQGCN